MRITLETFSFLGKLSSRVRIYLQRSQFYISMINFLLIAATAKQTYDVQISAFYLVPVLGLSVLILGFIDYIFVLPHELEYRNRKNDLKQDLEEIKKKIEDCKS